ncbi:MAG: hypothetical protein AAGA60_14985 [Cyanobacteria bacterium P01_E01_bin.42]
MKPKVYMIGFVILVAIISSKTVGDTRLVKKLLPIQKDSAYAAEIKQYQRLNHDILENATYQIEGSIITLNNGTATFDVAGVVSFDRAVYGDLNSDEIEDAVVFLRVGHGGTGSWGYFVPVINDNGRPRVRKSLLIGDRTIVNTLNITNQRVIADLIIYSQNDPLCCPSLDVRYTYRYSESILEQI